MRLKRLITGLVTGGLLGLTPLALATPAANAATTHAPVIEWQVNRMGAPYKGNFQYRQEFYVSGKITDASGTYTPGTSNAYLQFQAAGSSTWKNLAVDTNPGYLFFQTANDKNFRFTSNGKLRVVFQGYTGSGSTYDPSFSAGVSERGVKVTRKVTIKKAKAKLTIKGKVAPKYKRKKVVVHRKKGKRWVKHKTVRTNKKSAFKVKLPAAKRGKRLYFRITIPGNKKFTKYSEVWYTYSYRDQLNRPVVGR